VVVFIWAVALVFNKIANSEANGAEKTGKSRDKIASKMTPASISKAQSIAKECMSSNYKNCGW